MESYRFSEKSNGEAETRSINIMEGLGIQVGGITSIDMILNLRLVGGSIEYCSNSIHPSRHFQRTVKRWGATKNCLLGG